MSRNFSHLFEPGKIGTLQLKNRIVKSPQSTGLSNMDGTVSERLVRHYRELAKGGAGLIMVEYTYIDNDASKSAFNQLGISDNEHIAGLSWLVSNMKEYGAKAGIQIEHCGRQKFLGTPPIKAPSRIPWPLLYEQTGVVPEELTIEEIKQIVEDFGHAARRAKMAGFDIVEIHAAHGYLITNFLSPHTNKRNDLYGGSLENRMRFMVEVVRSVRSQVGPDYPLSVRVSGSDYEPDGLKIEESVEICKKLEELGIDVIHVSGGDHHTMVYQVSPMTIPSGPNVWAAEAIREAVSIPVMASGSITTPAMAEQILKEGKADFISMGRPLLADAYWPAKALEGRPEDIIPCIRCNDGCLERTFFNFRSIRCSVNPVMGREGELSVTAAEQKKKVVVIGGGPAGLEAARVSALRGHEVVLYEKGELGGSLHAASAASFKADIRNLIAYYKAKIEKLNIKVLHQEATIDEISSSGCDAAVVAVGGTPRSLNVPGEDRSNVVQAIDVLSGKAETGENVVVVGGGFSGTEAALLLAENSRKVTLVVPQEDAEGNQVTFQITYGEMFGKYNMKQLPVLKVEEISQQGLVVVKNDGSRQEIQADTIVAAAGYEANDSFSQQLRERGIKEVYSIGDCAQAGKIFDAVHAGFNTALHL